MQTIYDKLAEVLTEDELIKIGILKEQGVKWTIDYNKLPNSVRNFIKNYND